MYSTTSVSRPRDEIAPENQPPSGDAFNQSVTANAVLPTYTADQVADYLVSGYWVDVNVPAGYFPMSFDVAPGGSLSVDITGLTSGGKFFARAALEAWSFVTGLNFYEVTSGAQITFDDNQSGAFAGADSIEWGGTITTSTVNVGTSWIAGDLGNLNSYSFQTYMHEIGHALGLGHGGDYNGSGNYAEDGSGDNHYLNDSWQMSLMSYFAQTEVASINASYAFTATPMQADILAIQQLYGTTGTIRDGNTTYGENSNAGGYYDTLDFSSMTFTIYDEGGVDWIKFKTETANMTVDLADGAISSIGGEVGNMIIARDTIIENFFAGSGNDYVRGNDVDNHIRGGDGNDTLIGRDGEDSLRGNDGNDILNGNAHNDILIGGSGNDILRGGAGRDELYGGTGNDILTGGIGRDKLIGGTGADQFVFNVGHGKDKIRDFEDNIDTLVLDTAIWGGGMTVAQVLTAYGSYNAAKDWVELDFGTGDRIIVNGITDVNALLDDISFI